MHAPDQPLERVVSGHEGYLVVPLDLSSGSADNRFKAVRVNKHTYRLAETDAHQFGSPKETCACLYVTADIKHQMVFLHLPSTLAELIDRLAEVGCEFRGKITQTLKEWVQEGRHSTQAIFFINFRLRRCQEESEVEREEPWAFVTKVAVNEVAKDCGVNYREGATKTLMVVPSRDATGGSRIPIGVLSVMPMLAAEKAAELNGLPSPPPKKAVAVGAGALGSQILANVARAGYLPTHVVDDDRLFPHNLARHWLNAAHVGWFKAEAMADDASLIVEGGVLQPIVADVTQPGGRQAELDAALAQTEIIFDWTASVAASRVLAAHPGAGAPRVSMFLRPSGRDLVVLSEDAARSITLDQIEAQYYWHLADDPRLHDHLRVAERVRFARSCRDLSSRIPQAWISTLAGIASELTLRIATDGPVAGATIYRLAPETLSVERRQLPIAPMKMAVLEGWTVLLSGHVMSKIREMRRAKLPTETGGSLVGSWDIEQKTLHIVGALEAPPDSKSTRGSFIRGTVGQEERFEQIADTTMGMLTYLGEWHSHPDGVPPFPSMDDLDIRAWLADRLTIEGYPGIMLIMSRGAFSCMISGSELVPVRDS